MDRTSSFNLPVDPIVLDVVQPKLHLGCAQHVVPGGINIDGSWNARLARYPALRRLLGLMRIAPRALVEAAWSTEILAHDVRKRLPFTDGSVSIIYASHLLEHLYLSEAESLLRDCFRVLEPGGVLRLVVPDLDFIIRDYVLSTSTGVKGSDDGETPADRLNRRLLFRSSSPPTGSWFYRAYTGLMDFHSHKWMYDRDSLTTHIRAAGFAEVAEMAFLESRIPGIQAVERASRVLNGEGICVEGIKPPGQRAA